MTRFVLLLALCSLAIANPIPQAGQPPGGLPPTGGPVVEAEYNILWCGNYYLINNPKTMRSGLKPFEYSDAGTTGNIDADLKNVLIRGGQPGGNRRNVRIRPNDGSWDNDGGMGFEDGGSERHPTHHCTKLDVPADGSACRVMVTCNALV